MYTSTLVWKAGVTAATSEWTIIHYSIATCILIGWMVKPKTVIDEVKRNGEPFGRQKLYVVMIKFITPVLLLLLLLQSLGILKF